MTSAQTDASRTMIELGQGCPDDQTASKTPERSRAMRYDG